MTIEELKSKRERFRLRSKLGYADFIGEEACNLAISLIDEKILQLSVTDEDVGDAIEQVKWYIDFEKSEWANCDELSACEPGAEQIYKDRLKNCDIILKVLQQMRTEGCELCDTDFLFECNLIDYNGNVQKAIIADFCPNCGKDLR